MNSRVWIYPANRILSSQEQTGINEALGLFIQQWAAHGTKLAASFEIQYDTFIILKVDENTEPASGCSIDSSVHFIKELGVKFGFDSFNRNTITYLKEGQIDFTNLQNLDAAKGAQVFNTSISNGNDLATKFILPFEQSSLSKVKIDTSFTFSL